MRKISFFILLFSAFFLLSIGSLMAEDACYTDGVYEGEYSFVKVRVTVEDGKVTDIEILEHGGGGKKYEEMIKPLISAIIEKQSTEVDSITGATVSSVNLKKAVENALEARRK